MSNAAADNDRFADRWSVCRGTPVRYWFDAELVAAHRLDEDEAVLTAVTLVSDNPRRVFKL